MLKDQNYLASLAREDQVNQEQWYNHINQNDSGLPIDGLPCYDPAFDASAWPTIPVPSVWEDEGLGAFNGVLWFRKEIEIPASWAGDPTTLEMGNVIDEDIVYFNGIKIGTLPSQYIPRKYDIPKGLLLEGKNTIVVRVVNLSGKGGFYKGEAVSSSNRGSGLGHFRRMAVFDWGQVRPDARPFLRSVATYGLV
ncbi:sugar-binding domain-containing protein [Cohnella endophytica]|uniref:sugar-binding domain-containing protein n=1 Tax=Cohnella endophytica TaxID=2419778 RepID=UPI0018F6FE80|nr:sugar-binding domain-containing protein [Cohnella endophytica]